MRAALTVLLLAVAVPAAAQDGQAAFDEGVQALRAERYEAAAAAFQRSYELDPKAETACNLALTYDRWEGHSEDAIDAYLQCAQDDDSGRFRDHALSRASALRSQRQPDEPEELPPPDGGGDGDTDGGEGDGGTTNQVPIVEHGEAPPPRSRTLLYVGIGAAAVGLAFIVGGAVAAGNGRAGLDELEEEFPDRVITNEAGVAKLEEVEGQRTRALAFYVTGGIVAAAGLALAAIDLAKGSDDTSVSVAPTRGGAMATLRLDFD
ncbi:MAG: hypothetical protein JJ863_20805 [Deltaproteobacteria bacterium]|nr:hypothetical protein [Deltaproteobacteria bacterium]